MENKIRTLKEDNSSKNIQIKPIDLPKREGEDECLEVINIPSDRFYLFNITHYVQ